MLEKENNNNEMKYNEMKCPLHLEGRFPFMDDRIRKTIGGVTLCQK